MCWGVKWSMTITIFISHIRDVRGQTSQHNLRTRFRIAFTWVTQMLRKTTGCCDSFLSPNTRIKFANQSANDTTRTRMSSGVARWQTCVEVAVSSGMTYSGGIYNLWAPTIGRTVTRAACAAQDTFKATFHAGLEAARGSGDEGNKGQDGDDGGLGKFHITGLRVSG